MYMKFFITLTVVLSSFFSFSQTTYKIQKSELQFEQPFKAPYGTTYINPIDYKYISVKKAIDSLVLRTPSAGRFYPDMSVLTSLNNEDDVMNMVVLNYIPTYVAIKDIIAPFYIQNHEVTNNEYRTFLNSLSDEEKAKNYPDTTRWVKDFIGAYNEPMERVYYSHPKYDNYPVVGVNYYQAKAFCKWVQDNLNEKYKTEGYEVIVDLPNQFEWAFANGDKYIWSHASKSPYYQNQFYDKDYVTDLQLDWDTSRNYLIDRSVLPGYSNKNMGNYMNDGYLYTSPMEGRKSVAKTSMVHLDKNGDIQYMNTNVSEWCSETYQDNWKQLFDWRQAALRNYGTKEALITADLEAFYNSFNDTINGQMVRGGNWAHEHHAMRDGHNVGMHDAKRFIDPNTSHSTVGFRYVIRVVKKELITER